MLSVAAASWAAALLPAPSGNLTASNLCPLPRLLPPPAAPQVLKQRLVVRNAAAQLVDSHGNAADTAGVAVRVRLLPPVPAGDWEPPTLVVSEGAGPWQTDERGRAFLGDLSIAEGSGERRYKGGGQLAAAAVLSYSRRLRPGPTWHS